MLVNYGNGCLKTNFAEAKRQIARAGLDIDRLRNPVETLRGHVQLMRAWLDILRGQRRRPDELPIDEDLRLRHIGVDAQRA